MRNDTTWELPFDESAELELGTEWGNIILAPVEPGARPRLELTRGSIENVAVHVDKVGRTVRVAIDPQRSCGWLSDWECRATVYVPDNVRAQVQTNAGSVGVRDLTSCELGVKAGAGKIDLINVHGLVHLSADAGSITGRGVGGSFDVETQAGSVRLEIAELQPGEHRIRAAMGSVRLVLARGLEAYVETHTSLGSVRNSFPSRQGAAVKVFVSTEMGSVRVEEGSASRPGWHPSGPERPASPPPADEPRAADPELERILKMVEAGDLSAQEADELLRAMGRV